MPHKALKGKGESLRYVEAQEMRDKAMTEFLYYLCSIVDEATDDEDERAELKTNMAAKLENLISAAQLTGLLVDPDYYLMDLKKYDPEIRVEVIDYDDGEGNA